jgi:hypothetical protein
MRLVSPRVQCHSVSNSSQEWAGFRFNDPFLLGAAALWKIGSALHANVSIVGRP